MPNKWESSGRWVLVHLAVVVGLTTAVAVLLVTTPPNTGANIGAGLVGLPLVIPLGLPWSIAALVDPYAFDEWSTAARMAVTVGPAYLNVLLHAAWWRVRRSRR